MGGPHAYTSFMSYHQKFSLDQTPNLSNLHGYISYLGPASVKLLASSYFVSYSKSTKSGMIVMVLFCSALLFKHLTIYVHMLGLQKSSLVLRTLPISHYKLTRCLPLLWHVDRRCSVSQ